MFQDLTFYIYTNVTRKFEIKTVNLYCRILYTKRTYCLFFFRWLCFYAVFLHVSVNDWFVSKIIGDITLLHAQRPRNRGWALPPPHHLGKSALFANKSALFSWNRNALVSGTIELILKRLFVFSAPAEVFFTIF